MRILFQGGWKAERDSPSAKQLVEAYCRSLGRHVVAGRHQLILTSTHDYERVIAKEIVLARRTGRGVKDCLIYIMSDRHRETPSVGTVKKFPQPRWWLEERTRLVDEADVVIAIGGGKGTVDCVQKAFLAGKKVFVACAVPGASTDAWRQRRPERYCYIRDGDADFIEDLNTTPNQFFDEVFRIIDLLGETRYSRKVFLVHGRDLRVRDDLVSILRSMDFDPIVLERQPSKSLTVIEKLERDIADVGFAFIIYTPDDLGHLVGESGKPRARQNVIFEHGLLVGRLKRDRTCALVKGEIEIPSDLKGVIYLRFDDLKNEQDRIAQVLREAYP